MVVDMHAPIAFYTALGIPRQQRTKFASKYMPVTVTEMAGCLGSNVEGGTQASLISLARGSGCQVIPYRVMQ